MKINSREFEAEINGNILYHDLCDALMQKYDMVPVYACTETLISVCRDEGILRDIEYILESYAEEKNKPFLTVVYKTSPVVLPELYSTRKRISLYRGNVYKRILFVKQSFLSYMILGGLSEMAEKICEHEVILKGNL